MRRFISLFVWFFLVISLQTSVFAQTDSDGIKSLLEERDEEIKNILGPEGVNTPRNNAKL